MESDLEKFKFHLKNLNNYSKHESFRLILKEEQECGKLN